MLNKTSSGIDYLSIIESLDAVESCEWEEKSEYYFLYEENMNYLITVAADLNSAMRSFPYKYGYKSNPLTSSVEKIWNTVIAIMEDTPYETLAKIDPDLDPCLIDHDVIAFTQKKYREKFERLPKSEIVDLTFWVMSKLTQYLQVKSAYDVMLSVLEELENNNSMLRTKEGIQLPETADVF